MVLQLSVSKIGVYNTCHLKYWYQYVARIPRTKIMFYSIRGKFVHRILEEWGKMIRDGKSIKASMREAYKSIYREFIEEHPQVKDMLNFKEIKRWLKGTIRNYYKTKPTILEVEQNVAVKYRDVKIIGSIDRIDKIDENTIKIIDYKTSKNANNLTDFQLAIYYIATKFGSLRRIYGNKKIRVAYSLVQQNMKEVHKRKFTEAFLEQTVNDVWSIANRIKKHEKYQNKKHWKPIVTCSKESFKCRYCDYYLRCNKMRKKERFV